MKEFELNQEERELVASFLKTLNDLQQQFIGAQRAICALRGITGKVEFTDTKILITE